MLPFLNRNLYWLAVATLVLITVFLGLYLIRVYGNFKNITPGSIQDTFTSIDEKFADLNTA